MRSSPRGRDAATARAHALVVATLIVVAVIALVALTGCASDGSGVPAYTAVPTITEVIDGDTVVVRIGSVDEHVRLIRVDTPETKHPSRPVECYGAEAAAFTPAAANTVWATPSRGRTAKASSSTPVAAPAVFTPYSTEIETP